MIVYDSIWREHISKYIFNISPNSNFTGDFRITILSATFNTFIVRPIQFLYDTNNKFVYNTDKIEFYNDLGTRLQVKYYGIGKYDEILNYMFYIERNLILDDQKTLIIPEGGLKIWMA